MVNVTTEISSSEPGKVEIIPCAADLFGAEVRPLPVVVPEPFVPCNPSIVEDRTYDGEVIDGWWCSVRAVDYRLGVPSSPTGASSKNFLLKLDADLQVTTQIELVDRTRTDKNPMAESRGFEDLRLYWGKHQSRGGLWALATVCNLRNGGGIPEMVRLAIGKELGQIVRCEVMRGPWNRHSQKNWMPIADGLGKQVVYRAFPTLVIEPELARQGWITGSDTLIDEYEFITSSVRGSSQAIPFDDGWICIVHEHKTKRPLSYVHRFLWLDAAFVPKKISPEFVWMSPGVEFCAGLAQKGERMVGSFGVHDSSAHLAVFEAERVRAILKLLGD